MNPWPLLRRGVLTAGLVRALLTAVAAQPAGGAPRPIAIYFPPEPPVLGDPRPAAEPAPAWPAPSGLAAYVSESFYAPLSTRMANQEIDDTLAFRLDGYRAAKAALLTELHARIDTLKAVDPAARERALVAFAAEQTPRIAALEQSAEHLRADLCASVGPRKEYLRWRVGLFSLPPQPPGAQPALRRQLLAAAAYYQSGLSPEQRRLLRAEFLESDPPAPREAAGKDPRRVLAFSPATSRINLPPDLPPALAQSIADYRMQRAQLQTELAAVLFGNQAAATAQDEAAQLQRLAAVQDPQFARLENLAEVIRRGLAARNDPLQPPVLPAMPADLAERIAAYRAEKLALQQELLAEVELVKGQSGAEAGVRGPAIQKAITAFTRANAPRYAALDRARDSIRGDLAKLPGAATDVGASPDALASKFAAALSELEQTWDYRDYQTAALQPGLSPAQRRLLFDGALEKLALPLPGASLWFGSL